MVIYDRYDIVFQEIPNEISLAFTLKGCPNNCKGCHSPHLREKVGSRLDIGTLRFLLEKYGRRVTTVLFLGGDAYQENLIPLLKECRYNGLKTALYSGLDKVNTSLIPLLDYYKIGSYQEELGGLNSKKTNQRLYKYISDNGLFEDITHLFWR